MKKGMFCGIVVGFVVLLILALQNAYALSVDIDCPGKVRTGNKLYVTVTLHNYEPDPITISRALTGLMVNPSSNFATIDGVRMYGPFKRKVGPYTLDPGHDQTFKVFVCTIDEDLPKLWAGVVVTFFDDTGEPYDVDGCAVLIWP